MNLTNTNSETEIAQNILNSIPDRPKIPLSNYLLNLVTESDGKESSVYIRNVNKFIRETWDEITKSNYRKLNVRKLIPAKLEVGLSVFYAYKNGKKGISIQTLWKLLLLWKKYCNKSDKDVQKKWNKIFNSDHTFSVSAYHVNTTLPKSITPKLSYLIGWIIGDGSLELQKGTYVISVAEKSKAQLEHILKPLFKDCFNVDVPIFRTMHHGFRVRFGSKPVFRFFKHVLNLKVGKIPELIQKFDKVNLKYFLLGILDSEGYVSRTARDPKITISQSDLEFQNRLIEHFRKLDIYFTGPFLHNSKLGEWYTIRIRKKSEILKFGKLINSCHIDKIQRLNKLVNKIENRPRQSSFTLRPCT